MRVKRDLDSAAEYFISAGYIPRDLLKSEIELIRFLKVWTASWVPRVTELVVDDKREWLAGAGAKYIQQLLPPNDYWRKSTYELF